MKQKIKKLVKILAVLACLLIVLVIAAYFVFTKYYLPRYVQNDLLPQLAKRAGLNGFSGSIKRIGPFGADLGSLTIGPEEDPTLKVQSVKIDFSLNRLYSGRKLTITRAVFIEPELKCRIKNGDLYTGGETLHKFILDLCKGLAPGKGDQFNMELSSLEARNGILLLSCGTKSVKVPFKLLLNPIDNDWNKIAVKGVYEFPDVNLPLSAEIDLEANKAEFNFNLDADLKILARAGKLLDAPYVPSPGKLSGSVKCKVDGKAAVSPFKIKDYTAEGIFNSAQWSWNNFSFNAVDNGSEFKLHSYHDIMEMKISQLNANCSFDTIISDFRCTYRKPPRNHFDFSGNIKLTDKTIRLIPGVSITPIGRLLPERKFSGLYKPTDDYWRFNTGEVGQNDIPGKCAFTINKELTVTDIRDLQLSGQGRGQTGKLEFSVKVPLFSSVSSATKRNIDDLSLNSEISFITGKENIFNNVRIKADASFRRMILCESDFTRNIGKTNLSGQIICSKQKNNVLSKITVDGKSYGYIQSGGSKGRYLHISKPEFSAALNILSDEIVPPVITDRKYKITATSFDWTSPDMKISCSDPQLNDLPGKNKERLRKGSFGRLGIETKAGNIELWLGKYLLTMPENSGEAKLDLNFGKSVITGGGTTITTGSGNSVLRAIVDPLVITTPDKVKIESGTNTLNYKNQICSIKLEEVKNISSFEFDPTLDPIHGIKAIYSQLNADNFSGIYNKNKLESNKFSAEAKVAFKKNSNGKPVISSASSLISGNDLSMEGDGKLASIEKLIIGHKLEKSGAQKTLHSLRFNLSSASYNTKNIMLDKLNGAIGLNIVNGKPENGDINFTKGNLTLPKYKLDLKDLSFRMPFSWPLYKSNGDGTFNATIKWRKFGLGPGNFDISMRKQAVLLRGVFSKFPAPGERGLCFGRAKLLSDENFKLEIDLSIPEQDLEKPYHPGQYFPELDGVSFTGKAHAQFNIKADSDGISQRQLKLSLQNSTLSYFGHIFNKASTVCVFEDFMKLKSNPRQILNFESMKLGQLDIRDGSCSYQLSIPGDMNLDNFNGKWLGADVDTGAIKLTSSNSIQTIKFKCKKIPGENLLKFIGFKMPVCPADFGGSFKYTVSKGKGLFSDAEFQTAPGENLTLKLPDLKHLLKEAKPTGESLTAAALSDFNPNWVKLLFSSSNDNIFNIELSTNGRPASSLPFAPGPGNTFVQVSPDAVNAVSGEMELKLQVSRVGGNE